MSAQPQPFQLRNCAKWHDIAAKRNPKRAKHHRSVAKSLREQANSIERMPGPSAYLKGPNDPQYIADVAVGAAQ